MPLLCAPGRRLFASGLVLLFSLLAPLAALSRPPPPQVARYQVSFKQRATHLVDVQMQLPSPKGEHTDLFMPVWSPGSYLVRDHARHVQNLEAYDAQGRPLTVERPAPHRWRVLHAKTPQSVQLRYQLYAREPSVRTNFVDADFALLNGAATWILPRDQDGDIAVEVQLPRDWSDVASALLHPDGQHAIGQRFSMVASGRDELIDSPILAGRLTRTPFEVAGLRHDLVDLPPSHSWQPERAVRDLQRVLGQAHAVFGAPPKDLPYYLFLNVLMGGYGGLEHKNSSVLMEEPHVMAHSADYRGWLRLATHEYFHLWNVKRLRPHSLGPFNYEAAVPTEGLWIAEGFTAYYELLLLQRAGLSTTAQFFSALSDRIEELDDTPGERVRSLSLSAQDAWIRAYRPDENSRNSSVSYYRKGSLVAWLLDAQLRLATEGHVDLDHLMREAYARYSGKKGYTQAQFEALASELAGQDLSAFFAAAVHGTEPLDYTPALRAFGLQFVPPPAPAEPKVSTTGPAQGTQPAQGAWLGADFQTRAGRLYVKSVRTGGPAAEAGLNAEDELLAIGEARVPTEGGPQALLRRLSPGAQTQLLVARRGQLRSLPVALRAAPTPRGALRIDPEASAQTRAQRKKWLGAH